MNVPCQNLTISNVKIRDIGTKLLQQKEYEQMKAMNKKRRQ